jgi:4-diphosphocytidyl-2-C-methyl-D-erythritol kinase
LKKVKIYSPAKINLNLKVLNFDANFRKHKLKSKVSLLKLSDEIQIMKSKSLNIKYYDYKKKINLSGDIIKKTISYFDGKYKKKSLFNIDIKKKIPIGYGLGGGSSNAATTLKFLYSYHNINPQYFWEDAPNIGSDVLLFINQYPKMIDGLKNIKIIKVQKPRWKKIFIIIPSKKNLTKEVFLNFKKKEYTHSNISTKNDLTFSSKALNKEFSLIYDYLCNFKSDFKLFDMSGSGSSIFLSFKSAHVEKSIINDIHEKFPLLRIEKSYYFG